MAGAAIDIPNKILTFGPSCIADKGVGRGEALCIPLYYPKFWAMLDYRPPQKIFRYSIIKTFYRDGESPYMINTIAAAPAGVSFG